MAGNLKSVNREVVNMRNIDYILTAVAYNKCVGKSGYGVRCRQIIQRYDKMFAAVAYNILRVPISVAWPTILALHWDAAVTSAAFAARASANFY
jgi:hypothetical protein